MRLARSFAQGVLLATVLGMDGFAAPMAVAQQSAVAVRGTVLDASGKPAAGAVVRLEPAKAGAGSEMSAKTGAAGDFVFADVIPGTYSVTAEKAEEQSQALSIEAARSVDHLVLHLRAKATGGMAFTDQPNFTVAGITDWTAVGGHGSDITLRTSETLARETASLKAKGSQAGAATVGESETKLRADLAAAPESFEANHRLGEFCLHEGDAREAVAPLETAYRIDPANRRNEYDLALAYKGAGDFAKAREHIHKLLAEENTAELHRMAGDLDEAAGDALAAEREYEEAVRLDPSEENYFAWGSELLLHRAIWPAAEVFRKGATAYPKSARMLSALGAALFAGARYEEASQQLCEASDLNPADPSPYLFLGAVDMAAPGPLGCVEPKLKRFVEQRPEEARANYYYAMAIWKRQPKGGENPQEMRQVESLLARAVVLDPKHAEAWLQLGNLYFAEKDSAKAIAAYSKAVAADPGLSEAHYRLGVAYERGGDPAKAKREFELHDEIAKADAAAIERQREQVKQFLVVLQGKPSGL